MKKFILFLLPFFFSDFLEAQQHFEIIGKIANITSPGYVILNYKKSGVNILDTALLHDGNFSFSGEVPELTFAKMYISPDGKGKFTIQQVKSIFLEQGTVKFESADNAYNGKLSGTPVNVDYQYYTELQRDLLNSGKNKLEALENFLLLKSKSKVIPFVIDEYIGKFSTINRLDSLYAILPKELRNNEYGKKIQNRITVLKNLRVGSYAPDFQQQDTSGKIIQLKDFNGKYVLIDFWASWCSPCRLENPNILKNFFRYKNKNFTILSISLDNKKEKWTDAINKDGLNNWCHVSDLQGWKNDVAQKYNIHSVPSNFLIDPKGKIIAINLRGDSLSLKLSELFDTSKVL